MNERVPDLLVEKLHLGELAPAEAERVRARLAAEPGGLARLDALATDDQAFARQGPPRRPATPAAPARAPGWLRVGLPVALAAFAAVLIVTRAPTGDGGLRDKGGALTASRPALLVYRAAGRGPGVDGTRRAELLADGAAGRAGDVLQLAYVAVGRPVGAILSIDGRGATTVHLPASPLTQGGEVRLPEAFALDDAPGFERFVLVTFDTRGVLELTTHTVMKP